MEKQTKILGIAALIIAGLFYWNKESVSATNKKAIEDKATAEKLAAEKSAADKAAADKAAEEAAAEIRKEIKALADKQEADRIAAAEKALYDLMHPPIRDIEISYSSVKSDEWNNDRKYFDVYIPKSKNDKFYNLELTFYNGFGNVEKVRNITDSYIKALPYHNSGISYTDNMVDNFIVELNIITEPNYKYGIVVSILENAGLPNERIVKIPMKTIDIGDTFISVYE